MGSDCLLKTEEVKEALEPLFFKYKVDLVLNGHSHNYERSYPVHEGEVIGTYDDLQAPVYIHNGCGGAHVTAANDW